MSGQIRLSLRLLALSAEARAQGDTMRAATLQNCAAQAMKLEYRKEPQTDLAYQQSLGRLMTIDEDDGA